MNKWHAPGLGEVHSENHDQMIFCEKETSPDDVRMVDDEMDSRICDLLNADKVYVVRSMGDDPYDHHSYISGVFRTRRGAFKFVNECNNEMFLDWLENRRIEGKSRGEKYHPSNYFFIEEEELNE